MHSKSKWKGRKIYKNVKQVTGQDCPLRSTFLNVAFANIEEFMSKKQEGGLMIKKIWTFYMLICRMICGMKGMLERSRKYLSSTCYFRHWINIITIIISIASLIFLYLNKCMFKNFNLWISILNRAPHKGYLHSLISDAIGENSASTNNRRSNV